MTTVSRVTACARRSHRREPGSALGKAAGIRGAGNRTMATPFDATGLYPATGDSGLVPKAANRRGRKARFVTRLWSFFNPFIAAGRPV